MPYTSLTPGTTISSTWANANVRDQVVTPFASTAARDSAITSPVNGMLCVTTDMGWLWRYNGTRWLLMDAEIVAIADTSWTSNTTQSAIPNTSTTPNGGLSWPVVANSVYTWALEAYIIGQSGVGLSAKINQPSGSRTDFHAVGLDASAAAFNGGAQNQTGAAVTIGTFTSASFRAVGSVQTGATAGTVSLTFAQGVSSASTSWLLVSSSLRIRQES